MLAIPDLPLHGGPALHAVYGDACTASVSVRQFLDFIDTLLEANRWR